MADSSDDEEIARLLKEKDSKNTKKTTKNAFKTFEAAVGDLEKAEESPETLDKSLAKFFAHAKKTNGSKYKAGALQTLRFGLRRHYMESMGVDIVNDKAFAHSSKVFKAALVDLRRHGLGNVAHHSSITKTDMAKLYSGDTFVFNTDTPLVS